MNKFVKKHQKKFMAVFSVGLMIAFVATTGSQYGSDGSGNPVYAHLGEDPIHYRELQDARRAWDRLKGTFIRNPNAGMRPIPAAGRLGQYPYALIDRDPEVFLLLQKEAQRLGLSPSKDGVEEMMQNLASPPTTPEDLQETRRAMEALLLVESGYQRAASVLKTSAPQRQYEAATLGQDIKLHYIEYNADEYKPFVAAPNSEQLKKQFDNFANFLPDQPQETTNPFGFGYQYPNRVKVEFITVLRTQIRDAVQKSKDASTWELEARKYHLRNPLAYPTSAPAEPKLPELPLGIAAPTTAPTTLPATQPKVLGFDHYRQKIIDRLIEEETDKQTAAIRKRISTTLDADWTAYRTALGPAATQPATLPSTQTTAIKSIVGVPYGSEQYLPQLASLIQQEFKFLPIVNLIAKDWQTSKDLAGLPGIGSSELRSGEFDRDGVKFPDFAINYLDVFGHTPAARDPAPTLSLFAPSPVLSDDQENLHYFRVTAADRAHPPTDLDAFKQQVEADYKLAEAVKRAKEEMEKLLPVAKQQGLEAAAQTVGRRVMTSGTLSVRGFSETPQLKLKPESQQALVKAAFDLLKQPDAVKAGRTAAVVELPRDGKVLLISTAEVGPAPMLAEFEPYQVESLLSQRTSAQREQLFQINWFSLENVEKRLNFRPEHPKEKTASAG